MIFQVELTGRYNAVSGISVKQVLGDGLAASPVYVGCSRNVPLYEPAALSRVYGDLIRPWMQLIKVELKERHAGYGIYQMTFDNAWYIQVDLFERGSVRNAEAFIEEGGKCKTVASIDFAEPVSEEVALVMMHKKLRETFPSLSGRSPEFIEDGDGFSSYAYRDAQ